MRTEQIGIELDRYAPSESDQDGIERSREDHGGQYPLRFVKPLLAALGRNEVAASAFQRVPSYIHDFVASIYLAASKDPHLKDSNGLLAAIAREGAGRDQSDHPPGLADLPEDDDFDHVDNDPPAQAHASDSEATGAHSKSAGDWNNGLAQMDRSGAKIEEVETDPDEAWGQDSDAEIDAYDWQDEDPDLSELKSHLPEIAIGTDPTRNGPDAIDRAKNRDDEDVQTVVDQPVNTLDQSDASHPDMADEIDANENVDAFDPSHGHEHGHLDDDDDDGEEVDFYAVEGIDRNQSEPEDDDLEVPLSDVSPDGELGTDVDPKEDAQTSWSALDDETIAAERTLFSEDELAIERTSSPPREHADDTLPNEMVRPMEGDHEHPEDTAVIQHLDADGPSEGDQSNTPDPPDDERLARPFRFEPPALSDVEDEDIL